MDEMSYDLVGIVFRRTVGSGQCELRSTEPRRDRRPGEPSARPCGPLRNTPSRLGPHTHPRGVYVGHHETLVADQVPDLASRGLVWTHRWQITTPLWRTISEATNPIRRMLVSRSSLLNPNPLERCVRTTSPSKTVAARPYSISLTVRISAIVDFPETEGREPDTETLLVPRRVPIGQNGRDLRTCEPARQIPPVRQIFLANLSARERYGLRSRCEPVCFFVAILVRQVHSSLDATAATPSSG